MESWMNALKSLIRQIRNQTSSVGGNGGRRPLLVSNNTDVNETSRPTSGGHFRSSVWDPCLLISQILAVQGIFYVSLGVWIFLADWWTGSAKSLDQVFKYENFYIRDLGGTKLFLAYLLNAVTCAFAIWFIVQRAKLCLDFAATVHILHLLCTWIYNGSFPIYLSWWLLQIVCVAITTVLGEYLCLQTELKAIPVSLGPKSDV